MYLNQSKRVGLVGVFLRMAGLLLRISLGHFSWEIPRSSPASPWKILSIPPLLLGLIQSSPRPTQSAEDSYCKLLEDTSEIKRAPFYQLNIKIIIVTLMLLIMSFLVKSITTVLSLLQSSTVEICYSNLKSISRSEAGATMAYWEGGMQLLLPSCQAMVYPYC